jgi:hypothetical protein
VKTLSHIATFAGPQSEGKKLPLLEGFNLETLPLSEGHNLETLPLSQGHVV